MQFPMQFEDDPRSTRPQRPAKQMSGRADGEKH